jgi:uncharacterized membrane protein
MIPAIASLHPFIVHFAVALSMTSAMFDIASFFVPKRIFDQTGFVLMLLAIPFLLFAVLTGNLAANFIKEPGFVLTLQQHQTYATIAVLIFTSAGIWRVFLRLKKRDTGLRMVIYVFLITAAAMSVFLAAKKGGSIRHHGYASFFRESSLDKMHVRTMSDAGFKMQDARCNRPLHSLNLLRCRN